MRTKTLDEMMDDVERSAAALGIEAPMDESLVQTTEDRERMEGLVQKYRDARDNEEPSEGAALADPRTWADYDAQQAPSAAPVDAPVAASPAPLIEAKKAHAPYLGAPKTAQRSGMPDWDGLISKARSSMLLDDVVNAGNQMLARQGGWQHTPSKSSQALAMMPLEVAKDRQAMESRQMSADATRSKMEASAAERDPSSPQSQKARETWKALGLPTPPGFDEWSADDVRRAGAGDFQRAQQLRAAAEERERKAKEHEAAAEAKARAAQEKLGAERTTLEHSRRNFEKQLRAAGVDPETASQKDIDRVMAMVNAREGRAVNIGHADAKEQRDNVEKLAKLLPPDYGDFQRKFDEINQIVASGKGDIPGVGPVDANRPSWLQSNAGIELQKRAKQMGLAYQHLITGAGASDREREQLNQATIDLQDERSFMAGLRSLKDLYDTKVRQIRAGFPSDVVRQYDENIKREFGDAPKPRVNLGEEKPPPGAIPPNAKNVKRVGKGWGYTLPDGSEEVFEP